MGSSRGRSAAGRSSWSTSAIPISGIPSKSRFGKMVVLTLFLQREVLPYAPDSWYDPAGVKIGYEISFTRHFYKPEPMRPLDEIIADIRALEQESEGLLAEIMGGS